MMAGYEPIRIFDPSGHPGLALDRTAFLAELARGKTVLHVGCADDPLTEYRLASGILLHAELARTSRSLLGIDVSADAVALLEQRALGPVRVMDAEMIDLDQEFDLVIAGDVIEHMNNPGRFLERLPTLLTPSGSVVIGVPNALSFEVFRYVLSGVESTHRDHTSYHTPKTITELCRRFGLLPTSLLFTVQPKDKHDSDSFIWARNLLVRAAPRLAPGLIMEFKPERLVDVSRFYLWK